jgi:ADP-ribosyl-[dinitrogen reductase] hydrolase
VRRGAGYVTRKDRACLSSHLSPLERADRIIPAGTAVATLMHLPIAGTRSEDAVTEALRWDESSVLRERGLLPVEIGDRFGFTDHSANRSDRYRGALVGLGIGNALGRPMAGLSPDEIAGRHGVVEGYATRPNGRWLLPAGQLGGQAQMALISAAALVADGQIVPTGLAARLAAWLPVARTPGDATRQAISALRNGTAWISASVESSAADAAIRAVPVGLACPVDGDRLRLQATLSSVVTHRASTAVAAAVVAAAITAHLVDAASFDIGRLRSVVDQALAAVADPEVALEGLPGTSCLRDRIESALALAGADAGTALTTIGSGDDVLAALPAAIWSLATHPDRPVEAILTVVRAGGAAGTVGALTGAFVGALNGLSALPTSWVEELEYVDGLSGYADDLLTLSGTGTPATPAITRDPLHPATHAPFSLGGVAYPTLEHADPAASVRLRLLPTPADTRRYASTSDVRSDWSTVAAGTIGAVLRRRFDGESGDLEGLRRRPDGDLERMGRVFGTDEPFDYPVLLAIRRDEITELLTA